MAKNKSSREIRRLRERVLAKHELEQKVKINRKRTVRALSPIAIGAVTKTLAMLLIEAQFGRLIEGMLLEEGKEETEIAKALGISQPTVSLWRKRLGLR